MRVRPSRPSTRNARRWRRDGTSGEPRRLVDSTFHRLFRVLIAGSLGWARTLIVTPHGVRSSPVSRITRRSTPLAWGELPDLRVGLPHAPGLTGISQVSVDLVIR